ncbi:MAG: Fur family transcriptional regulator [Acidimicrobiales bacterium]|jgi:Fe2+ or Zn2+ uptake regulation protein
MSTASPDVNEILSAIRGATKRVTVAKRTVAEVLVAAPGHLTAEEITQEVQSRQPDVSPSTVYRILEELEALQIVVHAHLDQHAAVFHLAGAVHGHLSCDECGATFEVPAVHFDALSKDLMRTFGFMLDRHHMAVTGTCEYCQANRRL